MKRRISRRSFLRTSAAASAAFAVPHIFVRKATAATIEFELSTGGKGLNDSISDLIAQYGTPTQDNQFIIYFADGTHTDSNAEVDPSGFPFVDVKPYISLKSASSPQVDADGLLTNGPVLQYAIRSGGDSEISGLVFELTHRRAYGLNLQGSRIDVGPVLIFGYNSYGGEEPLTRGIGSLSAGSERNIHNVVIEHVRNALWVEGNSGATVRDSLLRHGSNGIISITGNVDFGTSGQVGSNQIGPGYNNFVWFQYGDQPDISAIGNAWVEGDQALSDEYSIYQKVFILNPTGSKPSRELLQSDPPLIVSGALPEALYPNYQNVFEPGLTAIQQKNWSSLAEREKALRGEKRQPKFSLEDLKR